MVILKIIYVILHTTVYMFQIRVVCIVLFIISRILLHGVIVKLCDTLPQRYFVILYCYYAQFKPKTC